MIIRRCLAGILVAVFLLASLAAGCAGQRKPGRVVRKPAIPEAISRGEGKEPRLRVYVVESGEVREMPLEEYVTAVVAGEMKNWFPLEALGAQAILARTFVLNFVQSHGRSAVNPSAHISTSFEEAQAWNPSHINDRIRKAVAKTRGMVAVYDTRYIRAWFHSHGGGCTATAKEGLNFRFAEPPYTRVVPSREGRDVPREIARWQTVFSGDEVAAAVRSLGKEPGQITTIRVVRRGPSGRATTLRIGDAEVHAADLRTVLGSTRMRSTLLTGARVEGSRVILAGKGFGHGVGMSQWGARELARRGRKADDIVRYYFRNVDIVKLW
ncbi:MAG: SpoIID/LytB domain protein [Clostridia bacterium 62_21]|nr:MAG: SpoIID/LytB domain protein [Clostridia bacterium 62_21]